SFGAIRPEALEKHCGDDVVAAVQVGHQFVEVVSAAGPVPQVMMRVNDRQVGIEYLLTQLVQPREVPGRMLDDKWLPCRHQAARTGSVPTIVVRCITRRSRGSCGVT